MSTVKIVAYIIAAILIFFGVLFLWAAFSPDAPNQGGRLLVGVLSAAIGLGIVVAVRLREPKPEQQVTIRQEIDIGGDVEMEALKCDNCGAQLDKGAIGMEHGAVMVNCPYCGATYQIVEEPKW